MLFASISDAAIAVLNGERGQLEERRRREDFTRRWLLHTGDFEELVRDEIRKLFSTPEIAKRVSIVDDATINVFRYVTKEAYRYHGAKRTFRGAAGEDEAYTRICRDLVAFDLVMREAVEAVGAANDCLIRVLPGIPDRHGRAVPLMRVFWPHEVTVTWDARDPRIAREVRYDTMGDDGELSTVVWTDTEHYEITSKGFIRPVAGTEGRDNPLGRLPFIAVHGGPRTDSGWDTVTGLDRYRYGIKFLARWSAVWHLLHQQSFIALKRTGCTDQTKFFDAAGPGVEYQLGHGEDLEALNIQANPAGNVDTLKASLSAHLASHGLNPERGGMNPGQAPPSGLARFLERQELLERRKDAWACIEEAEYDLADLFRQVWNWSNPGDRIDDAAVFEVKIAEESVVLSPLEQQEERAKKLDVMKRERELGLKSALEQLAEDRGISLEDATTLANSIKPRPEIFAYDQDNAIVTLDEIRASKGLGAHPNAEFGRLTLPELKALHPAMFATVQATTQE